MSLTGFKVGDKVKGSEKVDPSNQRFEGVEGEVVNIKGPRIYVDFRGDVLPERVMYSYELMKIPRGGWV